MELNRENIKKLMLLIAFGILVYLGLQNLSLIPSILGRIGAVFGPVIIGCVVAYLFNILNREIEIHAFSRLNRRFTKRWPGYRRPVSILVSLLVIAGTVVLIVLIIVPDLVNMVTALSGNIPVYINRIQIQYDRLIRGNPHISRQLNNIRIDWSSLSQLLVQYAQQLSSSLMKNTFSITANVLNGLIAFTIGFVIAVDILIQKGKLKKQAGRFLSAYFSPVHARRIRRVARLTDQAFSNFIVGQCLGAVILGLLCFIGMVIFRFPYALLISFFTAVLSLVPILGQIFSVVIGVLLILTVNPIQALWFGVFLIVLLQVHGNLIFPKIVGSKMYLPALWVLVAITLGGNVFGIAGMLISIPVFSVLYTLLREDVAKRLEKRLARRPEPKE